MLCGFMRLTVGLGLEQFLVVFDVYGLLSHLLLHGFGCNSDRGNRLRPATHLAPSGQTPPSLPTLKVRNVNQRTKQPITADATGQAAHLARSLPIGIFCRHRLKFSDRPLCSQMSGPIRHTATPHNGLEPRSGPSSPTPTNNDAAKHRVLEIRRTAVILPKSTDADAGSGAKP